MSLLELAAFLLIGGGTGLVAGYLGIGGGVIMVPVLTALLRSQGFSLDAAMTSAFATSLFTVIFTSGAAAWQQFRQDNLVLEAVPWTALGAVAGGQLGAWLGCRLPGGTLQSLFGGFLLLVAIYLTAGISRRGGELVPETNRLGLAAVGLVIGTLAALLGIGGGVLMVPAFIFLFRYPAVRVAGTSSAVAFLLALSGVAGYLLYGGARAAAVPGFWGVIDLEFAIPAAVGTTATAGIGARLNKRFGGQVYRRVFALFLAIVALMMLLK